MKKLDFFLSLGTTLTKYLPVDVDSKSISKKQDQAYKKDAPFFLIIMIKQLQKVIKTFFSRVHATLHPTLLVGRLVGRSVGHTLLFLSLLYL